MTKNSTMDDRVRTYLESRTGVPLASHPSDGIAVEESPYRTDTDRNRILVQRLANSHGVLITVRSGDADRVRYLAKQLTPGEIFSPLGHAEFSRLVSPAMPTTQEYFFGFGYVHTRLNELLPPQCRHVATPLKKADIPPDQHELRMTQIQHAEAEDFVWAFACYREGNGAFRSAELEPFGAKCTSIAIAKWTHGPVARLDVRTDSSCRGQGYGATVVYAATRWILEQGGVVIYDAHADNVPSLRLARRLGFTCLDQEMRI